MEKREIKAATTTQCFENYFHLFYLRVNKWSSCVFMLSIKQLSMKGQLKVYNGRIQTTKTKFDITNVSSVEHLHVCFACCMFWREA